MTQLAAMFANLILIETLHSRLTGQLFELDNFLSLVPSELQEVRLVTLESIHVLRNGLVATLETQIGLWNGSRSIVDWPFLSMNMVTCLQLKMSTMSTIE